MYRILLAGAVLLSSFVANAQQLRLIASSQYTYDGSNYDILDTTNYYYSFGRGMLPAESGRFGAMYPWAADSIISMNGQPQPWQRILHEFHNGNNRIITLNYYFGANTIKRRNYHYTNDKLDTIYTEDFISGNYVPANRYIYEYGPDGIVSDIQQVWNTSLSQYDNEIRQTYTYTSGLQTQRLMELWDVNSWSLYRRFTSTYTGNNLTQRIQENYTMGNWVNFNKAEFTYDVNNDNDSWLSYGWIANAWSHTNRELYTYDNNHNLLSETTQNYSNSQYTNVNQYVYTYNNANLVTSDIMLSWISGQFAPGGGNHKRLYYYQQYDPASAGSTTKENTLLKTYPNPANNTISIQLYTKQERPFGVTIFDATGKTVKHWNEAPTTFYQKQVDVSNLASGNYFLRIDNQPQEMVKFTIIK